MKTAIIDLGTNTFNLLIVEGKTTLYKTKIAVKLGEGGISKGYIAEAPFQRGLNALQTHLQTHKHTHKHTNTQTHKEILSVFSVTLR